jgi:tetratricopeptide (TPR) repeat protein/photosystem II stability/assembly factor-like uncharacterized protein
MSQITNPYFAGPPASDPKTFFGRQDVLRFVDETLASPMHNVIVFYGQRRIGKTSILHQIAHRSGQDYQAVFFDLQSSVTDRSAHILLYGLAREVAGQLNLLAPERADFQQDPDTFRTRFLPQVYSHLGDRRLLLLLDEFDALSLETAPTELDALPFVQALNRIIQSDNKRVVFLFVVGRRLKDLSEQQLQIFRGALDRQITLLRQEATLDLITRPVQDILTYKDAATERIWSLTSGHPYFTQLICHKIFNQAQRQNVWTVTKAHVEAVIDDAISAGQSALQWFWDEVPPIERFTLYTIGQLEAEGEGATLDQLIVQRNAQGVQVPDFELRALPDQLVDRQVLRRDEEDRYHFAVKLVRRWIIRTHSMEEVTTELTRVAVDEPAKTFFRAGQAAYRADDIDFAIENLSRALSINPDYVEARLWLARARAKTGDLLAAIDEFTYVERFGGREKREARLGLADARAQYGQQLEEESKIEEATQEYQRVLELDPQHTLANARLSEIFRQQADELLDNEGVVAAQPFYEQALKHNLSADLEREIKGRLDQYSQAQGDANNWEEAERASRLSATLMSRAGDSQEALLRVLLGRGRWHLDQHELEAAAGVYHRVLEETVGDAPHQTIQNDILRYSQQEEESNNWSQAEAALTLLIELFPDDLENRRQLADSLCRQAEFHLDQDNLSKAKIAYRCALADDPANQALRNLIRAGVQSYRRARAKQKTVQVRKSVEEALFVLVEILGQDDTLAYQWLSEARTDLGDALRAEGRLAEAQVVYQQAIDDVTHVLQFATEPDQAYRQRATIWLKLGQIDLAEARFDQAVEHFGRARNDATPDQEMVDQIKTAFHDYRHQQEKMLRWNYAERAMEILSHLLPDDEEVRFRLAETRVAQSDWHLHRALPDLEAARRLARSALEVNLSYEKSDLIAAKLKDSFQAYCMRQEQADPPNWAQAEQAMNSLVTLLPDDEEVHHWLADTRARQADWYLTRESQSQVEARGYLIKATEVCRRALNDSPGDTNLIARLKGSLRAYQRWQQESDPPTWSLIEQAIQALAELLPQDEEARQWLVETFLDQGNWFLQREPADLTEAKANLVEAKKTYEKALQVALGDKNALAVRIQEHFKRYRQKCEQARPPQWNLAEEAMAILAALLPEAAETRQQQAELYAARGDWLLQQDPSDLAQVEKAYQRALEVSPGSREVLATRLQQDFRVYRLKQQQASPPNWAQAEQAIITLATLLPDDDETHWQQAELYVEQGKWHLQREASGLEQAEAALSEAERYYREGLAELPGDKSSLIAQIKGDFKAYRLKQARAEPPRWHLAEQAMRILVDLSLADDQAQRQLAEVRAAWARACLELETDLPAEAEQGLTQAEKIYRRTLAELSDEQAFVTSLIKDDLNAFRLKQENALPPRWDLAERALIILAELLPEDEEIQGWQAETCLAQGRYYEDQAQAIGGWRWEARQEQKFEQAKQAYLRAVAATEHCTQLAPTNPAAWQRLAAAQSGLGHLYQLRTDETEALAAYDRALVSWQKVRDLGADTPFLKDIATTHIVRGNLLLQCGDLTAAGQDYLTAKELPPNDPDWLEEVEGRLKAYQAQQKRMGIQNQVVAAGELRHHFQSDNRTVWHELADELVVYGGQFLDDNEFELARQRYEQAMRPQPQTPTLEDDERRHLSRIISQDVSRFIRRQERANNWRQAEEARTWLAKADFLGEKAAVSSQPRGRSWQRRSIAAMAVAAVLCLAGVFAFGARKQLLSLPTHIAMLSPTATPTVTATSLPTSTLRALTLTHTPRQAPTNTPTLRPTNTPTPRPTDTPTPRPTDTPTPILTPTPSIPITTPIPIPYPAPQLVVPPYGAVHYGGGPPPKLKWEAIGGLGPNDYYLVRLEFSRNGKPYHYSSIPLKGISWDVPIKVFHSADPPERKIQWQVVVVQILPGGDVIDLSDPSETRTFTWESIPLPDGEGLDAAVDPENSLQVLVVLRGIGIYKSDNGGIDWRMVSNERTIERLHIAPANAKVVYAGAFAQVLKSEDQGETWRASPIPPYAQVYAITTDPNDANIVFVATDRGIMRSGDGGLTWLTLDRAVPNGEQVLDTRFYSIVAAKTPQGNRVYVAGEGDQIHWRGTDDTGSPWQTQVCIVCARTIFALAIDPRDSNKLLAGSDEGGLAISWNAGYDWGRTTLPPSIPTLKFSVLAFDPINPQIVYAGNGNHRNPTDGEGLYRSLDGGLTWQRFNTWAPSGDGTGTYVQGIALTPTDSQVILIAGSEGVFRSDDGGISWTKQ